MENLLLVLGLVVIGFIGIGFAICLKLYVVEGRGDGE